MAYYLKQDEYLEMSDTRDLLGNLFFMNAMHIVGVGLKTLSARGIAGWELNE